jgi:multiple sugar transport system substrate-binding protein
VGLENADLPTDRLAQEVSRIAILKALLILVALASILAGCGRSGANSPGAPVHVEVWTMWDGQEQRDFEQVVAYYNRTHPGVIIENYGPVDDPKTIRAIVAADPPDLCTLADAFSLGTLAANGAVEPLDSRFASSGLTEADYTHNALQMGMYGGHIYALPYLLDCIGLLYNKDVFKSAGLDPNRPPQTLEELLDDCKRITTYDSRGRLTRVGLAAIDPTNIVAEFGGRFVDPNTGRITADDPRNVEAISFYKRIMDAEGGYEAVNAFTSGFGADQSSFNPFFMGQIGIEFSGEWNPYWAFRYSPNMRYGVAPLPYPAADPDRRGTVCLGSNLLCIPRGSKHAKEAWDFLAWTQTPQAQEMLANTLHNVPNIRSVIHDPALSQGSPWRPYFGKFMVMADSQNAHYFPVLPIASLYVNQLGNAVDSVCYGHKNAQVALHTVTVRVERQMDQYSQ